MTENDDIRDNDSEGCLRFMVDSFGVFPPLFQCADLSSLDLNIHLRKL